MSIPLYMMNEHSEAYYIWHVAAQRGQIPREGGLLLHVDHHDDFDTGTYYHDFTKPMTTLEERRNFVDDALGIGDFIAPAMFDGLFDEIVNFTSIFEKSGEKKRLQIHLTGTNTLDMGDYKPFLHAGRAKEPGSTLKLFDYTEASHVKVDINKPCVLDIDLDYFCWDHSFSTIEPAKMEIKPEDYEAFVSNRSHPMRIFARKLVWAEREGDKCYIVLRSIGPARKPVTRKRIDERMDKFTAWLKDNSVKPNMIDICRSNSSGYCPGDECGYIEAGLMKRLSGLYKLQMMDYN